MPSQHAPNVDFKGSGEEPISLSIHDDESGYASASSSTESLPEVYFSKAHLKYLNAQLQKLEPEDILRWCVTSLPGLYQTTAFGLTGLVTLDMLSKLSGPIKPKVDLIFLDTLHHFDETLALVEKVRKRYGTTIHVYKPEGCETADDFAAKHGERLWETNDELYDYVAKVEPSHRAYSELQVKAVLTGRRRSQGGKRGDLNIVEVDETGLIKVNPLANWSFKQVQEYIEANNVPYNELLNRGYKSVGDWHSTQPVAQDEDERSGRWKGKAKTECGIHNPKSRYAQFLAQQKLQQQEAELSQALQSVVV
ncbi:Phosphoadenosine phosphosulfate reductase thioredoxin [Westerdykella ornata]|uniref:phosphoadenylyl-sulfate reductase (thioredoxin) n=1 Tax=Westerdykella ornata TaxID=318751 RepID=A0A6A6JFT1_WESOR|nr:Phosphoadenosine phosphosulfate reductase thioredoxin [Westerdykella ornata]KAF2275074.1 Phosphoadenosine phosphosulfate reductase thioredoxin [Westerdykella ornata]